MKRVAIIGAGLGGLSAGALLAKDGYSVTIYEKNTVPGGRASITEYNGFRFDMGPSWYLMPDAFELFFREFGKSASDYYRLIKLDPSYKVFFSDAESVIVRPDIEYMAHIFDHMERGTGDLFRGHMRNMKQKYELGISTFLVKDYRSVTDLLEPSALSNFFKLEFWESYHHSIAKRFKDERIQKILEFMVVFLGGSPYTVPGLYNLINWADFGLGVYYPEGGFFMVSKGFERLAKEQGVEIRYQSTVSQIVITQGRASGLVVNGERIDADIVVANADYPFVEKRLLGEPYREHSESFWDNADLAPSGLCIMLGITGKVPNLEHHTLFFNDYWKAHFDSIADKVAPSNPQYYVSIPSKTDKTVAPAGSETMFILVPLASGIIDSLALRERLSHFVLQDISQKTGFDMRKHIVYERTFGIADFEHQFNAYKGNAFGLGHTLKHSAVFRPKNYHRKIDNLFFSGHFTNPGTGTPLVVLSGLIVRNLIRKLYAHGYI